MRERLFLRAGGRCERCGIEIQPDAFEVAHLRAHANGGALVDENVAAWCTSCNRTWGARDVPGSEKRIEPRAWQALALPTVIERIQHTRVATVAAAPGAGKTVFSGFVFRALRELGLVERLVVFAPRVTLVKQWANALKGALDLELGYGREVELRGQVGVVVTYQSLNLETVDIHQKQASHARTLYVLDEVHHVGEPNDGTGSLRGFAKRITELIGDVNADIFNEASVLNLSGTLWRSKSSERISTVRYGTEPDGKLVSEVDFDITAAELIRQGQLRPVDLFRQSARVDLLEVEKASMLSSEIADLDDKAAGRAAIRGLSADAGWRVAFIGAVLDRLERRYRDLGKGPVKALIVARNQADARDYRETADRLMRERNLWPIATVAVSDDNDAQKTLEQFKKSQKVGVLCTVDMAGEGYDCPDIAVVGFASNKLTHLYVRQVVARAQRVTTYERQPGKRPIPAAIVIPDVPELVSVMSRLLVPMRHEIQDPGDESFTTRGQGDAQRAANGQGPLPIEKYMIDSVSAMREGDVRVTGEYGGDVDMDMVRYVEPAAREVGLPESDAPRIIVAMRNAVEARQTQRPFDQLNDDEQELANGVHQNQAAAHSHATTTRSLTIEEHQNALKARLGKLARWWARHGPGDENMRVRIFQAECNEAAGIPKGGRDKAQIAQLEKAVAFAERKVKLYLKEKPQLPRPSVLDGNKPPTGMTS